MKIKSKRLSKLETIPVLVYKSYYGSHFCILTGLVAAIIVARVFILHTMPPLAILKVCYSIASWILERSSTLMRENSSMQHTPQSARTKAPASNINSFPSLKQATVRPADVVPIPAVRTDLWERDVAYYKSWDLPVPGSPTISKWIWPRTLKFSFSWYCGTPPIKDKRIPSLTSYF